MTGICISQFKFLTIPCVRRKPHLLLSQDLNKSDGHVVKKRDMNVLDCIVESFPKKMRSTQMYCGNTNNNNSNNVVNEEESVQEDDGVGNVVTVAVPLRVVPHDISDASVRNRTTKRDILLSPLEAERIAGSFSSSFPSFVKVVKRFNISGSYTLNIPYQFAMENLPKCKLKIVLRNLKGESWTSQKETIDDNGREAVQKGKNVSKIYKSFGSVDKHGFHAKGCISMKSSPEEKIAAQYFASSFPHFVRIMKKFNVSGSYTLKIPYQFYAENLPNCKTEIILRNLNGKCWTVHSIPTTRVKTLHTFCGGWMAFVRDNDIKMDDICIFELVGKRELCVHICGIGKKGLNHQNATKNLPVP